jgi:hypothetical protein
MTKAFLSALLSFLIAIGAYAQNITVHGTVLSKTDDEPLIGVSVKTSEGNLGVATDIEVYAEGSVHIKQLNAWTLTKDSSSGIRNITVDKLNNNGNAYIYNLSGQLLRQNKTAEDALYGLPNGIYILKSGNKIEKRIIKQ